MKKLANPKVFALLGLFIAMQIIIERFLNIGVLFTKFGLGFLPISISSAMFGPFVGAVGAAIGDIVGFVMRPIGAFSPLWTVIAITRGLIYGFVLYKKQKTLWRIAVAELLQICIVELLLEPWVLQVSFAPKGFIYYFMGRLIALPVWIARIPLEFWLWKYLGAHVNKYIKD